MAVGRSPSATGSPATDPLSHQIKYNYASGKVSSVLDAGSYTESYSYNSNKLPTSVTDKQGKVWTYTYDSKGNMLTKKDPFNHTTYTYNAKNDVLIVTTQLSKVTTNAYDRSTHLVRGKPVLKNSGLMATIKNTVRKMLIDDCDDPQLLTFTEHAMESCLNWYQVEVRDPLRYSLHFAGYTALSRESDGRFLIIINRNRHYRQQIYADIAHECSHIVMFGISGLHNTNAWLGEMLACLTSQRMLIEVGLVDYAALRRESFLVSLDTIDTKKLLQTKMKRIDLLLGKSPYPHRFFSELLTIGLRLEEIVGWQNTFSIVNYSAWNDWLQSLPTNCQDEVSSLLQFALC